MNDGQHNHFAEFVVGCLLVGGLLKKCSDKPDKEDSIQVEEVQIEESTVSMLMTIGVVILAIVAICGLVGYVAWLIELKNRVKNLEAFAHSAQEKIEKLQSKCGYFNRQEFAQGKEIKALNERLDKLEKGHAGTSQQADYLVSTAISEIKEE